MNALTIILLIYVILDIVSSLAIIGILKWNGWTMRELAVWFRDLIHLPQDDFIEGIVEEYDTDYDDPYED